MNVKRESENSSVVRSETNDALQTRQRRKQSIAWRVIPLQERQPRGRPKNSVQEMENMTNVSIILYTVIQSDSPVTVFGGDAAGGPRLAEFRGCRGSRRDSLRRIEGFFVLHRARVAVMSVSSWRSPD